MKNLTAKLLKVQQEIAGVKKTAENPFFNSMYFDINGLLDVVKPVLSKHGLVILQPLDMVEGKSCIVTMIIDPESGEELASAIPLPELSNPQQMGSAITYYRRYSLQSILSLQSVDDDAETAMSRKPKAPKKPAAKSRATSAKAVHNSF